MFRVIITSLLFSISLLIPLSTSAQSELYTNRPTGFVNDYANFMNQQERAQLERTLSAYRSNTSNVIVVATLDNLGGYDIETVAEHMLNTWRMWEGDRQNGILLLVSREERSMRIEVGYGLEGAVPDILAGRIINEILIPDFRSGRYFNGFNEATQILMQLAEGEFEGMPQRSDNAPVTDFPFGLILILIIVLIFILSRGNKGGGGHHIRRNRVVVLGTPGFGRSSYGGGFSGGGIGRGGGFGGFSGGGGFGSGGGGASGRW